MANPSKEDEAKRAQELQQAQNEKKGYENSKWNKEQKVKSNNSKIDKLKKAKSNLETQKKNAQTYQKNLKKYSENTDNMGDWYGVKCQNVKDVFNTELVPQYQNYVDRIDEVLDSICNEITRLENENWQLNGDILYICQAINSLLNKIETLCN